MIEVRKIAKYSIIILLIAQILGCRTPVTITDNELIFVRECTSDGGSVLQYDEVVLVKDDLSQQYIETNLPLDIIKSLLYWDISYGRKLDTNKFLLKIKYESSTDSIYSTVMGEKLGANQVLKLEFWNTLSSMALDTSILIKTVCSFLELNIESIGMGENGEIRIKKNRLSPRIIYSEKNMKKEDYVTIFPNWFTVKLPTSGNIQNKQR